jgi:hypothetical protein
MASGANIGRAHLAGVTVSAALLLGGKGRLPADVQVTFWAWPFRHDEPRVRDPTTPVMGARQREASWQVARPSPVSPARSRWAPPGFRQVAGDSL